MLDFDVELQKQQKRAAYLRKKKAEAIRRDNEQIGKIVREVFINSFPDKLSEVKAFFEALAKNAEEKTDVQQFGLLSSPSVGEGHDKSANFRIFYRGEAPQGTIPFVARDERSIVLRLPMANVWGAVIKSERRFPNE